MTDRGLTLRRFRALITALLAELESQGAATRAAAPPPSTARRCRTGW